MSCYFLSKHSQMHFRMVTADAVAVDSDVVAAASAAVVVIVISLAEWCLSIWKTRGVRCSNPKLGTHK